MKQKTIDLIINTLLCGSDKDVKELGDKIPDEEKLTAKEFGDLLQKGASIISKAGLTCKEAVDALTPPPPS